MAHRLRLHFASRRSNTDPLSESLSSHGEESGVSVSARNPPDSLAYSSVRMKVAPGQLALTLPPLSPDCSNLHRYSSVFIPKFHTGGKKSTLQISLQPCGKVNGELETSPEDGDHVGVSSGSDGGSCTSDAGYCSSSSSSIFEPDVPEQRRAAQERNLHRRKAKVPLRRCSSLVIFPRSPCTTPPASPVSPLALPVLPPARGSYHTSHQLQLSASESPHDEETANSKGSIATGLNGLRLSKSSCPPTEYRDARPVVHFNVPEPEDKAEDELKLTDRLATFEQQNRHSSVLLHFAHQRQCIPGKGAPPQPTVNVDYPETQAPSPDQGLHHVKLYRSTSACVLPLAKFSEKSPTACQGGCGQDMSEENYHVLQRSFSLEVPCHNTGISCHVSKPKLDSSCSPHVHIHVSHGSGARVSSSVVDVNANQKKDRIQKNASQNSKVSLFSLTVWDVVRSLLLNKA
ncbi:E3 ubiquitin-protein ligase NEDD4-like [Aplochiton taeniatus]